MRLREALDYTFQSQTGWKKVFEKVIKYRKPFIINGYEINDWFREFQT